MMHCFWPDNDHCQSHEKKRKVDQYVPSSLKMAFLCLHQQDLMVYDRWGMQYGHLYFLTQPPCANRKHPLGAVTPR
jgi:hypothetical protein